MRAVRIAGAEPAPIGAPADWQEETHGHCGALFVRREHISGINYMRSAWEVEATEAHLLLAGASLYLGVAGHSHPVVSLAVGDLPADFEPVLTARRFSNLQGDPMVKVEMLFAYGGGRRAFCDIAVEGTLGDAISAGVARIEALARDRGWFD